MTVRYIRVSVYFGIFSERRSLTYDYTYIRFVQKLIFFFGIVTRHLKSKYFSLV